MKIIYIHGFGSSGEGPKAKDLRAMFPDAEIISPSLSHDPAIAFSQLSKLITENKNYPIILAGTSLGGFYSLVLGEIHGIPGILINPSLTPWVTLKSRLGVVKNYNSDEQFELTQDHLDVYREMYDYAITGKTLESSYLVLASKNDELIDHSSLPHMFTDIHWDNTQDHQFKNIVAHKEVINSFLNFCQ